jgi:hypothetical protein
VAPGSLRAEDRRTCHDKRNNDEHHWDSHEDRAYCMWVKENHRKAVDFSKLKEDDQQAYWAWRHEHSDARLKIDIRWRLNRFSGPRRAASMAAMSIFFIVNIASKARFPSPPPAASASVSARGVICQESPQRSLHQPHWLSAPPLPTIAFQ